MEIRAPSPLGRNRREENEAWLSLVKEGVMSKTHLAALNDLDLEVEQEIIKGEANLILPKLNDLSVKNGDIDNPVRTMGGKLQQDTGKVE